MKQLLTTDKSKTYLPLIFIVAALILLGIGGRLLPHLTNFSPLLAIALFAGFFFAKRLLPLVIITTILLVTDFMLGGYDYRLMLVVYGALFFPFVFKTFLRSKLSVLRLSIATLSSSIFFFLTTNFAVWLFASWYSPDLTGLIECYVAGLPFFKYTLLGDLGWSGILFGTYAFTLRFWDLTNEDKQYGIA